MLYKRESLILVILAAVAIVCNISQCTRYFKKLVADAGTFKNINPTTIPIPPPRIPPIEELAETSFYTCPNGLIRVNDTHLPWNLTHFGRKIPKVIHMTAKSRCVPPGFYEHLQKWMFPGHSFYFHDDAAVYRLLYEINHTGTTQEFVPNMTKGISCVTAGATKSDLWRYLLLWHYGGIYSDVDNAPTGFNETTITPTDDSFFVIEGLGIMSQFFMASSPQHPLMRYSIDEGIRKLQDIVNVMVNNPAKNTGPGALKRGFIKFQKAVGINTTGYIDAGVYEGGVYDGLNSSTNTNQRRYCTVVGDKERPREFIRGDGLTQPQKMMYYKALNMTHYHGAWKKFPRTGQISCREHIQRQHIATNGTYYKVANYVFRNGMYVEA